MKRTKVKSRKSYSIIAILSLLMVFMLNGILAYLKDTEEVTNVFTIGEVNIELIEKTTGDALYSTITNDDISVGGQTVKGIANLVPGQEIAKKPYIKNTGRNNAYVYMQVSVPVVSINGTTTELFSYTENSGWTLKKTTRENVDGVTYNVYKYQYDNALAPNGETVTLFDTVTVLDTDLTPTDIENMGEVQQININAYAIQTEGLTVAQGYSKFFPGPEWEIVDDYGNDGLSVGDLLQPKNEALANEQFYVIGNENGNVTLLAQKLLKNTPNENGGFVQTEDLNDCWDYDNSELKFDFSNTCYWSDEWNEWYDSSSPNWRYLTEEEIAEVPEEYRQYVIDRLYWKGTEMDLNDVSGYGEGDVMTIVKDYASNVLGVDSGRLLNYDEAKWLNESNFRQDIMMFGANRSNIMYFWLGTAYSDDEANVCISAGGMNSAGGYKNGEGGYIPFCVGIRPVIEIPETSIH